MMLSDLDGPALVSSHNRAAPPVPSAAPVFGGLFRDLSDPVVAMLQHDAVARDSNVHADTAKRCHVARCGQPHLWQVGAFMKRSRR